MRVSKRRARWPKSGAAPAPYALSMDLVLTLVSIASFFALVVAWTVLPASGLIEREAAQASLPGTQAAH